MHKYKGEKTALCIKFIHQMMICSFPISLNLFKNPKKITNEWDHHLVCLTRLNKKLPIKIFIQKFDYLKVKYDKGWVPLKLNS